MIKKIISGGQTGADRAALDVALKFNIPHGGWLPKGRKTEDGPLPKKYKLKELTTASYPARTVKNVQDSDGTVIFSHGKLTGGSKLTQKLADKHDKPCLRIDLNKITDYMAVFEVRRWRFENHVEILNVAGPRASGDPEIYDAVFKIIKGVYLTDMMRGENQRALWPGEALGMAKTVDEAVEQIIDVFSLRAKVETANLNEGEFAIMQAVFANYIRDEIDGWMINKDIYKDRLNYADRELLDDADAATVILKVLWDRLKETHKLRLVK